MQGFAHSQHPSAVIDSSAQRAKVTRMMFLLRSLFWLSLVYFALPLGGVDLASEWNKAKDSATQTAAQGARDWCVNDLAACAKNASEAADLMGLLPKEQAKGSAQDTLRPTDLQPAWRGHEKAKPARG